MALKGGYENAVGKTLSYIRANSVRVRIPVRAWVISSVVKNKTSSSDGWQMVNNLEPWYKTDPGVWSGFTNVETLCSGGSSYVYDSGPWFSPTGPHNSYPGWLLNGSTCYPGYPCTGLIGWASYSDMTPVPNPNPFKWHKRRGVFVAGLFGYLYESLTPYKYSIEVSVRQESLWLPVNLCSPTSERIPYKGPWRVARTDAISLGATANNNCIEGDPFYDPDTDAYPTTYQRFDIMGQPYTASCSGGIPWTNDDTDIITPIFPAGGNYNLRTVTPDGTINFPFGSFGDQRFITAFADGVIGRIDPGTRLINALETAEPYQEPQPGVPLLTSDPQTFWADDVNWLIDYISDDQHRAKVRAWRRQYRNIRILVTDQQDEDHDMGWADLKAELEAYPDPDPDPTLTGVRGTNPSCVGDNPFDFTSGTSLSCGSETYTVITGFEPPEYIAAMLANPFESGPVIFDWGEFAPFVTHTSQLVSSQMVHTYLGYKPRVQGPVTSPGSGFGHGLLWSDPTLVREIFCFVPISDRTYIWLDPGNKKSRIAADRYPEPRYFSTITQTIHALFGSYWGCGGPTVTFCAETATGIEDATAFVSTIAGRDPGAWLVPATFQILPKDRPTEGSQPVPRAFRAMLLAAAMTNTIGQGTYPHGGIGDWRTISAAELTDFETYPFRGIEKVPGRLDRQTVEIGPFQGQLIRIWVRSDPFPTYAEWSKVYAPVNFSDPNIFVQWPTELARWDGAFARPTLENRKFNFGIQNTHSATRKGGSVSDWMRSLMCKKTARPSGILIHGFENLWEGYFTLQFNVNTGQFEQMPQVSGSHYAVDWNYVRSVNRWDHYGQPREANETTFFMTDWKKEGDTWQRFWAQQMFIAGGSITYFPPTGGPSITDAIYSVVTGETFGIQTDPLRQRGLTLLPGSTKWNY